MHIISQESKNELIGQRMQEQYFNQVRGLSPWPTAYTTFQGDNVKVWAAKMGLTSTNAEPGEVIKLIKIVLKLQLVMENP